MQGAALAAAGTVLGQQGTIGHLLGRQPAAAPHGHQQAQHFQHVTPLRLGRAKAGQRRLRRHQIDLIAEVGVGLARAVKTPGVATLLKLSRGPARATGLGELQGFLERGFAAFAALGDGKAFVRAMK